MFEIKITNLKNKDVEIFRTDSDFSIIISCNVQKYLDELGPELAYAAHIWSPTPESIIAMLSTLLITAAKALNCSYEEVIGILESIKPSPKDDIGDIKTMTCKDISRKQENEIMRFVEEILRAGMNIEDVLNILRCPPKKENIN
jgi:hypothetical protein